jgi:hypothetical protein
VAKYELSVLYEADVVFLENFIKVDFLVIVEVGFKVRSKLVDDGAGVFE